jgi:hypothetical protein
MQERRGYDPDEGRTAQSRHPRQQLHEDSRREAGNRSRRYLASAERPTEPGRQRRAGHARRLGSLPPGKGVGLILAAAVIGSIVTTAVGQSPGLVLGCFLVAGTAAASLALQWQRAYIVIPVPAPACIVTSVAAGIVRDRALDTSGTALAINASKWVASGFIAMTAATIIAILIPATRYFLATRAAGLPRHGHLPRT